ncbi:uncharacterized protein MONBRDRAFT_14476, partial [Monosiga brevicollis MX1]
QTRLASIRALPFIAKTIGPVRTRDELVPYLLETIDDEDEAIAQLALEAGALTEFVGDVECVESLLPLFEELASSEEAVIRERAATGLNKIAGLLTSNALYVSYIPLVDRLTTAHWPAQRTTACALYPTLYTAVTDEGFKQNVIMAYADLCRDNTPMVRRAAATYLKEMLKCCSAATALEQLRPLFSQFMEDAQDSVRLLAVGLLPELARSLPASQHATIIVQSCVKSFKDDSWRVRYMLADVITELQSVLSSELSDQHLLPAFVNLLNDSEPEVRTCAARQVHAFSLHLGTTNRVNNVLKHILPSVERLVSDESDYCRAAIATVIMGLSSIVGKDYTIELLLPQFLALLKDSHAAVRSYVCVCVCVYVCRVAYLNHWSSVVYAVRRAAIDCLCKLTKEFGSQWCSKAIMGPLKELAQDSHFSHRLTSLFACADLSGVCEPVVCKEKILPMVLPLAADKIPNIRINVAKTLETLLTSMGSDASTVDAAMRPTLEKLVADQDVDVRYFADRALQCEFAPSDVYCNSFRVSCLVTQAHRGLTLCGLSHPR